MLPWKQPETSVDTHLLEIYVPESLLGDDAPHAVPRGSSGVRLPRGRPGARHPRHRAGPRR
jgi:hypothetical protein